MSPPILIIAGALLFLTSGVILFLFVSGKRRIIELKEKTGFAIKANELVKVEMNGDDAASSIALNFNVLGEKLINYRKEIEALSWVKLEKQELDLRIHDFEDSLLQLNLLTDIGRQITSCLNINDIALKLYKFINSSMVAEELNILIMQDGTRNYFNVFNGKITNIIEKEWYDDKDNILNWSYDNNKEVYLNEATNDYAQYVFKPLMMRNGKAVESVIAIPLGLTNKMIGAVSVLCGTKNSFNDFHLDFARSLSSYVSVAIDNANLYRQLDDEKQKSEDLLLNILPNEVANELKEKGKSEPRLYESVTVIFTDFVNFTGISETLTPKQLVEEIDLYFKTFDEITERHGLEKIKTIGDAYLAVCGLPNIHLTHSQNTVSAAIEIMAFVNKRKEEGGLFEIRIGINSGPVVAGIVGNRKFAYDIWGDTVNLASRMQSSSEPGKINISGATYNMVKDNFHCVHRGKIGVKNKGMTEMYFVQ